MIELRDDHLIFRFPDVHQEASLRLNFQRTLRIPDDGNDYPLPPGLGRFPLRHVDDHGERVPGSWLERGGVMLPMYQAEAMWMSFDSEYVSPRGEYPFLVKIATGKINAVSGEEWVDAPQRDPQDYVVVPTQPWLDGYCVEKGFIRQFVAMPLGAGYTAEEQLSGEATWGGVQICVYPMKREVFERRSALTEFDGTERMACCESPSASLGLAPGGRMRQEIFDDPFDFSDWDLRSRSRCFVHIANSMVWRQITGNDPPTTPPTAKEYERARLPWFDYYGEAPAIGGSELLRGLKSVAQMGAKKGDAPLPENETVSPRPAIRVRPPRAANQVREW